MLHRLQQLLEPEHYVMRDMTPAQIARAFGATVADYIVELRRDEYIWHKLYIQCRDGTEEQQRENDGR